MSALLLLTHSLQPSADVMPGLALLNHTVKILPAQASALIQAPPSDLILIDARKDLAGSRDLSRMLTTMGTVEPILLVVTEGGLAVVNADWGMTDVILDTASPAELDARIRIALSRRQVAIEPSPEEHIIRSGDVYVDEAAYTAKLGDRLLDLTYKEFELLKYLAQHPGRVFTRDQPSPAAWGYDYFGGTRTVDVHIRRLRAKLGPEKEGLIGTVRNVGYRFVDMPVEASDQSITP